MCLRETRHTHLSTLGRLVGAGSLLFALAAGGARADVPAEAPANDVVGQLSVAAHLGLGAPAGYYGGHLEVRVLPELGIGAHVGDGSSGIQVGASLRGYLYTLSDDGPMDVSFIADLAYSAGLKSGGSDHQYREGTWHWAHVGAGAVFRPAKNEPGFMLAMVVGAAMLLGGPGDGSAHVDFGDVTIVSMSPGSVVGPWMQLSLGWIF